LNEKHVLKLKRQKASKQVLDEFHNDDATMRSVSI